MKKSIFKIESNVALTANVYKMELSGDCSEITKPGMFVNVEIKGQFLRRPISVCNVEGNILTLIYKVVGIGTEKMSAMAKDEELDILTGLGNGYDLEKSGEAPLLIGGGVGVPPMYLLARKLIAKGAKPKVILGFNTKSEVFYEEEFKALGLDVTVTTADGSHGIKGFVTNAMENMEYTFSYSCGPEPMLKAIYNANEIDGQFSFEERMACGFGACMGCSCKTKYGNKRICKDGPCMNRGEIIW